MWKGCIRSIWWVEAHRVLTSRISIRFPWEMPGSLTASACANCISRVHAWRCWGLKWMALTIFWSLEKKGSVQLFCVTTGIKGACRTGATRLASEAWQITAVLWMGQGKCSRRKGACRTGATRIASKALLTLSIVGSTLPSSASFSSMSTSTVASLSYLRDRGIVMLSW